jgi:methyltransferase (TIGR00027 family)
MRTAGSDRRVETRASDTAEVNAAQRAAESRRKPEARIVHDPYARCFVQRPLYRALARSGRAGLRFLDRRYAGLNAIILLRARYATEVVAEVAEGGVDQVVLLGAGYDSTAARHDGAPVTVYEVDSPATQRAKLSLIEKHRVEMRQRVVYVPCDFERDSLRDALDGTGFDRARPCVLVWFGVSYYLTRDALAGALADVAAVSATGSTLLLDYIDPEIPDGTTSHPGARRLARSVERRGEPYRSGFTDEGMRDLLRDAGFGVREQLRMPDLGRRFGGPDGAWCRTDDLFGVVRAERTGDA